MIVTHCELCGTRMTKDEEEFEGIVYWLVCPQCGLVDNPKATASKLSRSFQMNNLGIEKYRRIMGEKYANE